MHVFFCASYLSAFFLNFLKLYAKMNDVNKANTLNNKTNKAKINFESLD